jgi:hypothetical protein
MGDTAIYALVGAIVGVICLVGGFFSLKRCQKYYHNLASLETLTNWKKSHHTVLTSNFVKTFTTPINDTYHIEGRTRSGAQLGKGTYGVVYMGHHRDTKKRYAIKLSMSVGFLRHRVEREYKLLKDIDHPNIVKLYAVYDSPNEVRCTYQHM